MLDSGNGSRYHQAMATARCVTRLPWNITTPRGPVTTITQHFAVNDDVITQATMGGLLSDIETWVQSTGASLGSVHSGEAVTSIYNLGLPEPRTPAAENVFTFTPGADQAPTEVAVNIAVRAANEIGTPRRQGRGRIQLGPWSATFISTAVDETTGLLTSATCDSIAAGYAAFLANATTLNIQPVVGSIENGFREITEVRVGNELGTVRRRQNAATYVATETL